MRQSGSSKNDLLCLKFDMNAHYISNLVKKSKFKEMFHYQKYDRNLTTNGYFRLAHGVIDSFDLLQEATTHILTQDRV